MATEQDRAGRGEDNDFSDGAALKALRQMAEQVFGITFSGAVHSGADRNFLGIRADKLLVSQRLDSRTYFIQDMRYGFGRENAFFRGSDREHLEVCEEILRRLAIPSSEVAKELVLKEKLQTARYDTKTKEVFAEKPQEGRGFVQISRQIERLPVWSSSVLLGLSEAKRVGYMQLHWPDIPPAVVLEAHRLDHMVRSGWLTPERPGAFVDVVEAGIIHSPAIGFLMDFYPCVRVIYKSEVATYGQWPVEHFDRHGRSVPIPRQAEMPQEPKVERKAFRREGP
jgi:hypothetical protein